jgi:subtilase family serine protease
MKVVADTGSTVNESDETNNFREETWGCPPP